MISDGVPAFIPWSRFTEALQKRPDRSGSIQYVRFEAPFIIVPAQDPNELAIDDLGFERSRRWSCEELWLKSEETEGTLLVLNTFEVSGGSR